MSNHGRACQEKGEDMKAILEGTVEEIRSVLRTGTVEDLEQVCMFCGCTDIDPCHGGCSWVAPNVCSRCANIVREALVQEAQEIKKPGKNVPKRSKTTVKAPEEVAPGKVTPDQAIIHYSIDNLLIPTFEHDKKLKSSYKTLFFTESDDGTTVLVYSGTKLYVNREKVLELPNPVPHGYFGKLKSGTPSNRATAIRFYREYLAELEQKVPEREKKKRIEQSSVVSPLFSGKNGVVIMAPFTEAERFDYSKLVKNTVGTSIVYEHPDGRITIKQLNHKDVVTTTKEWIMVLKKLEKDALNEYLKDINTAKQWTLKKYIGDLKDDDIGALGKVRIDTCVPKD